MPLYPQDDDRKKITDRLKKLANPSRKGRILFVDFNEVRVGPVIERGFRKPGWYWYREYERADGTKFARKELLRGYSWTGNRSVGYRERAMDDDVLPDQETKIKINFTPEAFSVWRDRILISGASINQIQYVPDEFSLGEVTYELHNKNGNKINRYMDNGRLKRVIGNVNWSAKIEITDGDIAGEFVWKELPMIKDNKGLSKNLRIKHKDIKDLYEDQSITINPTNTYTYTGLSAFIQTSGTYTDTNGPRFRITLSNDIGSEPQTFTIPILDYRSRTVEYELPATNPILYTGDTNLHEASYKVKVKPYTSLHGTPPGTVGSYREYVKIFNEADDSLIWEDSNFRSAQTRSNTFREISLDDVPFTSSIAKFYIRHIVSNHDTSTVIENNMYEQWNSDPITIAHTAKSSNADIASITITGAPAGFTFNKATTAYTLEMPSNAVAITALTLDETEFATVTIAGSARTLPYTATIGSSKTLAVPIVVTAHDGTTKTYTFTFENKV